MLYFHSIAAIGAVRTSAVTFLIPKLGIVWRAIVLGESAPPGTMLGLGMILGGVGIVSGANVQAWIGRARGIRQQK